MSLETRITELENEIRERQELVAAYRRVAEDMKAKGEVNGTEQAGANATQDEPRLSWRSDNQSGAVRNAIRHMTTDYSINNIDAWLKHNGFQVDRKNISFVLARFARSGEIKVQEKGAGKRPTIYISPF